ncbi:hypothetical protein K431DRAFT_308970, partial [Polychaeton citri CBS 116435]
MENNQGINPEWLMWDLDGMQELLQGIGYWPEPQQVPNVTPSPAVSAVPDLLSNDVMPDRVVDPSRAVPRNGRHLAPARALRPFRFPPTPDASNSDARTTSSDLQHRLAGNRYAALACEDDALEQQNLTMGPPIVVTPGAVPGLTPPASQSGYQITPTPAASLSGANASSGNWQQRLVEASRSTDQLAVPDTRTHGRHRLGPEAFAVWQGEPYFPAQRTNPSRLVHPPTIPERSVPPSVASSPQFPCREPGCGMRYYTQTDLSQHTRNHYAQRRFGCSIN